MSWLDLTEDQRPPFPVRERLPGKLEVQCPACGQWRRGFLLEPLAAEDAATLGVEWACDAERTALVRAAAPPDASPPSQPMPLAAWIGLFTAAQQAAMMGSADDEVRVLVLTRLARPSIDLLDPATEAAVDLLAAKGVLGADPQEAAAEAARIKAGQPHEESV